MIAIDQWGTFDVANYGDLLFPLLLEHQLTKRLGAIQLTLSSPHGGAFLPKPSRRVRRIVRFEEEDFYTQALRTHAFVLGGGDIARLDDIGLAGLYGITGEAATTYRSNSLFLDDLGALARVRPVFWNAVGVPYDFSPDEYERVRRATRHVRYLSVRDRQSRRRLEEAGIEREIYVVPDTALLLPHLLPEESLDATITRLQAAGEFPTEGQILSFQVSFASPEVEAQLGRALATILAAHPDVRIVLLPIGICHDDLPILRRIKKRLPERAFLVDHETSIAEVAAVIRQSAAFLGSSLHGNITAFTYGVGQLFLSLPFYTPTKAAEYAALFRHEHGLIGSWDEFTPQVEALLQGQYRSDPQVRSNLTRQVEAHFDRIAESLAADAPTPADDARLQQRDVQHSELVMTVARPLADKERHIKHLTARLADQECRTGDVAAQLAERTQEAETLAEQVANQEHELQHLAAQVAGHSHEVESLTANRARLADDLATATQAANQFAERLHTIESRLSWRLLAKAWEMQMRVAPPTTPHGRFWLAVTRRMRGRRRSS